MSLRKKYIKNRQADWWLRVTAQ